MKRDPWTLALVVSSLAYSWLLWEMHATESYIAERPSVTDPVAAYYGPARDSIVTRVCCRVGR